MPRDKVYHLIAGCLLGLTEVFGPFIGVFFVILGASAKETYDEILHQKGQHPVGWDWPDFVYTIVGGFITIGVTYVF